MPAFPVIGRHKQQALLAALVASASLVIAIPHEKQPADIDAVNAAQRAAAAAAAGNGNTGVLPGPDGEAAQRKQQTRATPTTTAPATTPSTPANDTPPKADPPTSETPSASSAPPTPPVRKRSLGPAGSLRRTGTEQVALTFDDGPDPVNTPKMLDLLKKYDVKATFCLVGQRAKAHPELVRRTVAEGHLLCNHSFSHSFTLGKKKPAAIRKDLAETSAVIRAAVPDAEIPYFRAPGGNFTEALVSVATKLGMTSLYWQVDPRDWEQPEEESDDAHIAQIVAKVQQQTRSGAIVLSHDTHAGTIAAYEKLLPLLKKRYRLGSPTQR